MKAIALLLLVSIVASSMAADEDKWPPPRWDGWCESRGIDGAGPPSVFNLPGWACEAAFEFGVHKKYAVFTGINPFYVLGDFDAVSPAL